MFMPSIQKLCAQRSSRYMRTETVNRSGLKPTPCLREQRTVQRPKCLLCFVKPNLRDMFDILVNDTGKVSGVRLVSGHPMLASSAINAAKGWTFRPMKHDGKAVWFHGHLRF